MENNVKRRLNPIELFIFCAVLSTFGYSVYQLMTPAPFQGSYRTDIQNREVASIKSEQDIEVQCNVTQTYNTGSAQVRLAGTLCAKNVQARILNQANRFQAAVFSDSQKSRYTTEYIPLNPGKNPIYFEFKDADGKTLSQVVTVNRN